MTTTDEFEPLVVRRSAVRTWLIALAAVPAIVIGIDVIWRQRIVRAVSDFVFDSDPQLLEMRDTIWAWALVIVGGSLVAWGLKELFAPAAIIRTDTEGIHLRLKGPFRRPVFLPWDALSDVDGGELEFDEDLVEVLIIETDRGDLLPIDPFAGRRFDTRTLAMYATDWDTSIDDVVTALGAQALQTAKAAHTPWP